MSFSGWTGLAIWSWMISKTRTMIFFPLRKPWETLRVDWAQRRSKVKEIIQRYKKRDFLQHFLVMFIILLDLLSPLFSPDRTHLQFPEFHACHLKLSCWTRYYYFEYNYVLCWKTHIKPSFKLVDGWSSGEARVYLFIAAWTSWLWCQELYLPGLPCSTNHLY